MSRTEYKPDCGYAWIVVAACFTINFIMAGLVRAAGVLYVALIDVYGVSREVATTPFSLRYCLRNVSGPLVGVLGQRFGIRPVIILGGFVCGLGGILSAFATDVTWITFAWGGVHGFGYGLCNILHVIVLTRYFDKYKGLALGINYTGDCFGTFLLPLLLDFLLDLYGLNGTFLILAGISLNVVPAGMLLMSPPWERRDSIKSNSNDMKHLNMNNRMNNQGISNECFDNTLEEYNTNGEKKLPRDSLPFITIGQQKKSQYQQRSHITSPIFESHYELNASKPPYLQFSDFYSNKTCKNHRLSDSAMLNEIYCLRESASLRVPHKGMKKKRLSCQINAFDANRKNSQISVSSVLSCPSCIGKSAAEKKCNRQFLLPSSAKLQATAENGYLSAQNGYCCDQRSRNSSVTNKNSTLKNTSNLGDAQSQKKIPVKPIPLYEEEVLTTLDRALGDIETKTEMLETNTKEVRRQNPILQFLRTNIKPMFLIISATMALFVFLFISVFTIIIDYAADNDIPYEYGKYLIIAFSVTDIFGRVGFGVVLDRKWLSLHYFAGLTTGLMGLCIFVIPLFKSFTFWMISFSLCGLIEGGTCIMFPVLIEHYMERNEESIALGSLNFYGGLLMLPIPPMIGFFRDAMGSYDGVFWTVGALCIFAGSLWIFEPHITRKKEKKICEKNYCFEEEKF